MAEVLRKGAKTAETAENQCQGICSSGEEVYGYAVAWRGSSQEFIDRIEVSHADKKSKTRKITIVYNFIGAFDFTRAIEEAHNTTQKQQKTA